MEADLWDGQAELLMPSLSCLQGARRDAYYVDVVAVDEAKFMDLGKCRATVGWEEVYVAEKRVLFVEDGMVNPVVG